MVSWIELFTLFALIVDIITLIIVVIRHDNKKR